MKIEGTSLLHMDAKVMQNNPVAGSEIRSDSIEDEFFIGEQELVNAIDATNDRLESYNRRTVFSIHEKTGDVMIKILDTITNEVVREIPPEKIKDMVANMLERAGLLIDKKA